MERLKLLREEKQISQQKLAEHIGTNQQNIHRYEHGYYEPDIGTLKRMAAFFNISVDYLIGNADLRHKIESLEKFDLNEREADLIERYRNLSVKMQDGVSALLEALVSD